MKILLVNPPNCGRSIPEEEYGIDTIKMIFRGEPLALEVIAGNLDGHDVAIADLKVAPDELEETLDQFAPDLVGFTGVTCEANTVLRLAGEVKRHSGALVVVGGHHASCDPEFFNHDAIDYIVVGPGQAQLQGAGRRHREPDGRRRGRGCRQNQSGREPGLCPAGLFPCGDLVDDRPPRYDLVAAHRDQYVMSGVGGKVGFVASAYGCTHRCIFCSIPNMTGRRYLTHRPAAVLRDMKLLGDVPVVRLVDANTFGDLENALRAGPVHH